MVVKRKTLGEFFNHDFEKGCFRLYDSEGREVYYENSNEYWYRYEHNSEGRVTYYENSNGYWYRYDHDSEGRVTYYENSDKNWYRYDHDSEGREVYYENSDKNWYSYEYDSAGRATYYENSYGVTGGVSREVVEMTMEEVEKLAGKKVKIVNNK